MSASAWRGEKGGVRLFVRLTPKAARDAIDGLKTLADGQTILVVRVRAVPEKGAANAALERLLAERLDAPRSAVSIVAGAQARTKQIRISGDPDALDAALKILTEAAS